ncbi:hypothetical protein QE364_002719 [Nocardioides zeae]|uniref:Uncharacterized protein n=1 Tax=Nocardioides zeae TaxID=1457234 RepID=A0ACC6IJZ8_9ACTN|nr:hypothetical protein [Nocardioides zeae]
MESILFLALGALATLWLLAAPSRLLTFFVGAVLFSRTLFHLTQVGAIEYADEFAVVLLLTRALLIEPYQKTRLPPGSVRADAVHWPGRLLFGSFVFLGVFSGVIRGVDLTVLTAGTVLAAKAVIAGWAVSKLSWSRAEIRRLRTPAVVSLAAVLGGSVMNLVAPVPWNEIFSVSGGTIDRYGLPSLISIFIHPFDLAFYTATAVVIYLAIRAETSRTRASWTFVAALVIQLVLTFRRKDLLALVLAVLSTSSRRQRLAAIIPVTVLAVLASPIAVPFVAEQAQALVQQYLGEGSEEARTVLTVAGFGLASQLFPFGAGFGRFGSRTAAENYSPDYYTLGFDAVYGLGPGSDDGFFLTDTAWPAIIGESGYIGAASFLAFLLITLRWLVSQLRVSDLELRVAARASIGLMVITIIDSLGAPVFSSPPAYGIAFVAVGVTVGLARQSIVKERDVNPTT